MTSDEMSATLRDEGVDRGRSTIAWGEAASYLLDAWPRAEIFDALAPDLTDLVPSEFHFTRVNWMLPIFVVRAMEHQAARAWNADPRVRASVVPNPLHARRLDDYIADLLYAEIEPATVEAFRNDTAFQRAFHYPLGD